VSPPPRSSPPSAAPPVPPSFPTKRARRLRDALFVVSVLVWAGAMYAVWSKSRAAALAGEEREPTVFTEAFERNIQMRFAVKAFGRRALTGDIVRRTKEPYEGRLIVRMKGRTVDGALGEGYFLEFYEETRWDRARGGFVMSSMRLRWSLPEPLGRTDMRATATRVSTLGSGELLVLEDPVTGNFLREPIPVTKNMNLSAGLMPPAPVKIMYVGARWKTAVVNPFTRELKPAEVEVVEEDRVPMPGPVMWGFRAVTRVEKETGQTVEQSSTWYDLEGKALMQSRKLLGVELVLERVSRLPGSEDEWEKMAPPEESEGE